MARYILHSHWYLDRSSKERVKSFIPHTHTHTHTHTHQLISFYAFIYIYVMSVMSALFVFDKRLFYPNERHYTTLHSIQNPKLWQSIPIQCYTPIFIWIELELLRGEWSEVKQFQISKWICNFVWFVTAPRPLFIYVIPLEQNKRMESRGRGSTSSRLYSTVHWNRDQDGNPIQSNPWVYIYIYIHTLQSIYFTWLWLWLWPWRRTHCSFLCCSFFFIYYMILIYILTR